MVTNVSTVIQNIFYTIISCHTKCQHDAIYKWSSGPCIYDFSLLVHWCIILTTEILQLGTTVQNYWYKTVERLPTDSLTCCLGIIDPFFRLCSQKFSWNNPCVWLVSWDVYNTFLTYLVVSFIYLRYQHTVKLLLKYSVWLSGQGKLRSRWVIFPYSPVYRWPSNVG